MNPLGDAIKKRRMNVQAPENSMEELLKSLKPEQKQELFEMLKTEISGPEGKDGLEDESGQLKQTPGEKEELNMEVAQSMYDPNMDLEKEPQDFMERAKQKVSKFMKGKGY